MYEFNYQELSKKYSSKPKISLGKLIILGIMAGAFIALGAASSNAAIHAVENTGVAKSLAGAVFPVGLIMIVFLGGELFTGDCLMFFGVLEKKISLLDMMKVLLAVWLSNMIGSLIMVFLVNFSGQLNYTDGLLGAYTIKIASTKLGLSFGKAFASGILCNVLVCAAVIMAAGTKDTMGKIGLIFIPIFVFVIGGYEHCVANMYYIPAGILASMNPDYADKAMEMFHLSQEQINALTIPHFFLNNLLPVTLGNIAGGTLFVALPLFVLHFKKNKSEKSSEGQIVNTIYPGKESILNRAK